MSKINSRSFQGLGTIEYKQVMRVVEQAILATDLALYFRYRLY
jgi:hypothetical protein